VLPVDMAYHSGNFHEYKPENNVATNGKSPSVAGAAKRFVENFYKTLRFAIPGILTAPIFVFFALGLWGERWNWRQLQLSGYLLAFVGFFWIVVVPFFHINERYLVPLMPICFIWIGRGTWRLYDWLCDLIKLAQQNLPKPALNANKMGSVLLLVGLFFFSFLPELGKVITRHPANAEYWSDAIELKAAGKWIRENSAEAPLIMSYNKAIDFYAGVYDIRRTASFSNDTVDRVLRYADYKDVTHIVVDERYRERFPNLAELFDPRKAPKSLELVQTEIGLSGQRVFVYRLCRRSTLKS
jgi:hypothetical protein